jgi:hypothetical protein
MKTSTLPLKHSMNGAACRFVSLLIPLALFCFALSPQARATCEKGCGTHFNTFLGDDTLVNNTSGIQNTAIGNGALTFNTTGFDNTATGARALTFNTTGYANTAIGISALNSNTTGGSNTAVAALGANTTGNANTGVGVAALASNITGNFNTALGFFAGYNTNGNTNIAVGYLAGQSPVGDNNIDIGNLGGVDDSGVIRIGTEGTQTATHIAGIRQTPLTNAVGVAINADGQLGIRASSARFKEAIKPMDKASETVLALKPVTFRYKNDPAALPQFGLVAEEVAKVNPDLVARDKEGKPFTVRYDEINAMLLNEFLKEHRKNEEQGATIARLEKQVEMLTAGLQKVSAQLEVSKSPLQTVLNSQ